MKDRRVMNAERVACFGKEESYWNDLLKNRWIRKLAFNGAAR